MPRQLLQLLHGSFQNAARVQQAGLAPGAPHELQPDGHAYTHRMSHRHASSSPPHLTSCLPSQHPCLCSDTACQHTRGNPSSLPEPPAWTVQVLRRVAEQAAPAPACVHAGDAYMHAARGVSGGQRTRARVAHRDGERGDAGHVGADGEAHELAQLVHVRLAVGQRVRAAAIPAEASSRMCSNIACMPSHTARMPRRTGSRAAAPV